MAEFKEFKNVSRTELTGLRKDLAKQGITVPEGDDVKVEGPMGIKMRILYEDADQLLRLEIIDKPLFIPESQIWKVIERGASRLK